MAAADHEWRPMITVAFTPASEPLCLRDDIDLVAGRPSSPRNLSRGEIHDAQERQDTRDPGWG
jgi:hypothetical protein